MATTRATSTKRKTPAKRTAASRTRTTVATAPAAVGGGIGAHIQQSLRSVTLWRALGAELIGTFLLAAAIITGQGQPIIILFALVGIVLLVGGLSGAHLNPAITIGALVTRRIGWLRAVGYVIAQVLGAILAFVTLSAFLKAVDPVSAEAQLYSQAPTLFQAVDLMTLTGKEWFIFFAELLGTSILGFAIANASREVRDRTAAAFTIGLGIFIALMVAVSAANYAGGSAIINPAVAISLNALSWNLWPIAAYVVAPVIGAVIGFVLFDLLRGRER